ncbi:GNAT family N-acetyltransferase [Membranihabitans marinus]|uniref:GNAT family N-acetyltransferase n=1 Tax=Membranihabitans marinus TaxID=1227546 RepID=UPI001F160D47|nr:GNAT family N-acetyltransferase [Membranihabitans marinus]
MIKLKSNFRINPLKGELPYQLLLLADETNEAIHKYIFECKIFTLNEGNEIIGVIAIKYLSNKTIEIKNLAIREDYQKLGLGRRTIQWLKDYCIAKDMREILVGTGDGSIYQLLFYQKCGFEIDSIRKSFFINNYDKPIYENGIRLRHMVVLKLELVSDPRH